MFDLITPFSYWVLTILWLLILVLYLTKLRQSKVIGGTVAVLLTVLAIDAFRTVFESAYFGLYFNSKFGLLPSGIFDVLSQPGLIVIPKLINVFAGCVVLFLLVYRWIPREVSEREEWVERLRESEERFQDMTSNVPGIVYQFKIDAQGKASFPYVSSTIKKILGLDAASIIENSDEWFNIIHPDDMPGLDESIKGSHKTLEPWQWEGRMIRTSGEAGWFKGSSIPQKMHDGSVLWNGLVIDITKQKLAEGAHWESEERYRAIVENQTEMIRRCTPDGVRTFVNDAYCKNYGILRDEIIGTKTGTYVIPEDRPAWREHIQSIAVDNPTLGTEIRVRNANGEVQWHHWIDTGVFDETGNLIKIQGIGRDITKRKQAEDALLKSENRFKEIAEMASDWFWEMDENLCFTSFSNSRQNPSGLLSEELLGKTRWDALGIDLDKAKNMRDHKATLEAHKPFRDFQFDFVDADGKKHYRSISGNPMFDEAGTFRGYRGMAANITRLKQAEEARVEIENRFRTIVDGAPVAITLKDKNGNFLIGNKTLGAWTKTDPSKIADNTLYDFYPKEDADKIVERDRLAMETGEESVAEVTRAFADGVTRTILSHKCPVLSANGEIIALATILADITALKKAEQKILEDSETKFRESIESIPNGVAVLDKNDRFVLCNSAYQEHLEKIEHLLIPGTPFEDIVRAVANAGIVSEAREDAEAYTQRRMDLHRSRKPSVLHIAATDRWVIIHDYDTSDGGIYHVRTDITDQKMAEEALRKSEERFKDFAETGSDRFWEMDEKFRFTVNIDSQSSKYPIETERFIGCTRWEAAGADPKREEKWQRHYEDHLAHRPYRGFEFTITSDDGKILTLSVSGSPTFDNTGTFKGYRGTSIDITKLRQAEQQARKHEEELSNARRLNTLGAMGAAIAHELNQPLAVISSYAQGVAAKLRTGTVSPDDLLEPIESLVDQANRASEIITGIRSLVGNQKVKKTAVDLNATIKEAIAILNTEHQEYGIDVMLELDNGMPRVLADKVQIQQLIMNLARNSIEAMSKNSIAPSRLTIQSAKNGGGTVEVAIMDTGPGFQPKERERIFEPFFSTKNQGLGLGLSICRSISEANGGRIWMDHTSGMGATIRFSLPVADERQHEDA